MRTVSLLVTLTSLLIMAFTIKILDSLYVAFAIMISCAMAGLILLRIKGRPTISNIGWGMLYGSLTVVILMGGFLFWLIYNFPK